MKLKNIEQVHDLIDVVNKCDGDVWLTSQYGDRYSLKSKLSQYIAIGALLGEHGDELELFAANKDDEARLLEWLVKDNIVG